MLNDQFLSYYSFPCFIYTSFQVVVRSRKVSSSITHNKSNTECNYICINYTLNNSLHSLRLLPSLLNSRSLLYTAASFFSFFPIIPSFWFANNYRALKEICGSSSFTHGPPDIFIRGSYYVDYYTLWSISALSLAKSLILEISAPYRFFSN